MAITLDLLGHLGPKSAFCNVSQVLLLQCPCKGQPNPSLDSADKPLTTELLVQWVDITVHLSCNLQESEDFLGIGRGQGRKSRLRAHFSVRSVSWLAEPPQMCHGELQLPSLGHTWFGVFWRVCGLLFFIIFRACALRKQNSPPKLSTLPSHFPLAVTEEGC